MNRVAAIKDEICAAIVFKNRFKDIANVVLRDSWSGRIVVAKKGDDKHH